MNNNVAITILLQQCKQGNQKAMFTVYNQYSKTMFNVAFRIVGKNDLAEEIIQDCFLKAFKKLDDFSGDVTFGAWLKKIVVNKSITELNKSKKVIIEPIDENYDFVEIPENEIEFSSIKAEKALQMLQELKTNYKIILTLFFIEGYDLEEITTILNISYENARTMMSRAKQSLRNKMTSDE